jgi:hypothetical protein
MTSSTNTTDWSFQLQACIELLKSLSPDSLPLSLSCDIQQRLQQLRSLAPDAWSASSVPNTHTCTLVYSFFNDPTIWSIFTEQSISQPKRNFIINTLAGALFPDTPVATASPADEAAVLPSSPSACAQLLAASGYIGYDDACHTLQSNIAECILYFSSEIGINSVLDTLFIPDEETKTKLSSESRAASFLTSLQGLCILCARDMLPTGMCWIEAHLHQLVESLHSIRSSQQTQVLAQLGTCVSVPATLNAIASAVPLLSQQHLIRDYAVILYAQSSAACNGLDSQSDIHLKQILLDCMQALALPAAIFSDWNDRITAGSAAQTRALHTQSKQYHERAALILQLLLSLCHVFAEPTTTLVSCVPAADSCKLFDVARYVQDAVPVAFSTSNKSDQKTNMQKSISEIAAESKLSVSQKQVRLMTFMLHIGLFIDTDNPWATITTSQLSNEILQQLPSMNELPSSSIEYLTQVFIRGLMRQGVTGKDWHYVPHAAPLASWTLLNMKSSVLLSPTTLSNCLIVALSLVDSYKTPHKTVGLQALAHICTHSNSSNIRAHEQLIIPPLLLCFTSRDNETVPVFLPCLIDVCSVLFPPSSLLPTASSRFHSVWEKFCTELRYHALTMGSTITTSVSVKAYMRALPKVLMLLGWQVVAYLRQLLPILFALCSRECAETQLLALENIVILCQIAWPHIIRHHALKLAEALVQANITCECRSRSPDSNAPDDMQDAIHQALHTLHSALETGTTNPDVQKLLAMSVHTVLK